MNRERAKELLPIIQAFAEGKEVQYRSEISNGWRNAKTPSFENDKEYRIKPEPREFWITFENGVFHGFSNIRPTWDTASDLEVVHVREVLDD